MRFEYRQYTICVDESPDSWGWFKFRVYYPNSELFIHHEANDRNAAKTMAKMRVDQEIAEQKERLWFHVQRIELEKMLAQKRREFA